MVALHLRHPVDINRKNVCILDGNATDLEKECNNFEKKSKKLNRIIHWRYYNNNSFIKYKYKRFLDITRIFINNF